jgi:hypothetical protein
MWELVGALGVSNRDGKNLRAARKFEPFAIRIFKQKVFSVFHRCFIRGPILRRFAFFAARRAYSSAAFGSSRDCSFEMSRPFWNVALTLDPSALTHA